MGLKKGDSELKRNRRRAAQDAKDRIQMLRDQRESDAGACSFSPASPPRTTTYTPRYVIPAAAWITDDVARGGGSVPEGMRYPSSKAEHLKCLSQVRWQQWAAGVVTGGGHLGAHAPPLTAPSPPRSPSPAPPAAQMGEGPDSDVQVFILERQNARRRLDMSTAGRLDITNLKCAKFCERRLRWGRAAMVARHWPGMFSPEDADRVGELHYTVWLSTLPVQRGEGKEAVHMTGMRYSSENDKGARAAGADRRMKGRPLRVDASPSPLLLRSQLAAPG
jgi:hypothetical protein